MGKTKDRPHYQSVSLPVPFIKMIKGFIKDKPEYRSIADFVKTAAIEKMTGYENKTISLKKEIESFKVLMAEVTKEIKKREEAKK